MKLIVTLVAGVAAAVLAAPAFAQEAPQPNVFPAKKVGIAIYADTVTASPGESIYGVSYPIRCTQLSLMRRGEGIVFRMWAVDTKTGKTLTDQDLKFAFVRIPGVPDRAMRFTPHGRTEDAPWFWATRWDVPLDYPLGIVDFQIIVRTKKVDGKKPKTGVFTQPNIFGLGLGKLEIVESRPNETPAAPGS